MRKPKYSLYTTNCKRCGKPITTSNMSLYGANSAYEKYHGICSDCITDDEQNEMEKAIEKSVFNSLI